MEGIHVDSYDIISYMKFEKASDYETYLRRLQDFPRRVNLLFGLIRSPGSIGHLKDTSKALVLFLKRSRLRFYATWR